ncbi:MAG TPA: thiamine phosphate synthase [Acidobacteriaceae bacterium]|nr:thiamine phosphate synthase [Acidobacteriaceae bacterium]
MPIALPKLYPILDSSALPVTGRAEYLDHLGRSLADAGLTLLEYRNKPATDAELLADAEVLRAAMPQARLILDDRIDVALAAGFNGVHVDTGDLPPAVARRLMPAGSIIGTSAGGEHTLHAALAQPVDYISFGPVFPTTTKQTSAQPIGIEGVQRFRALAGPEATLVAAAGITLETAPAILAAGASTVAVAAAIFRTPAPAAELRRWLTELA